MEIAVEMPVVRRAEAAGWFVRKVSWPGRIGAPDRVFIKCGRVVWIEFKAPGKEPRQSQVLEHDRMRKAGAELYWFDNIHDALAALKRPSPEDIYRDALQAIADGSNDARRVAVKALRDGTGLI